MNLKLLGRVVQLPRACLFAIFACIVSKTYWVFVFSCYLVLNTFNLFILRAVLVSLAD